MTSQTKLNGKDHIPLRPRHAKKLKTQRCEVCICHSLIQKKYQLQNLLYNLHILLKISNSKGLYLDSYTNKVAKPYFIWHLKYCVSEVIFANKICKSLGYNPEQNMCQMPHFQQTLRWYIWLNFLVSQEKVFLPLPSYFSSYIDFISTNSFLNTTELISN